MKKKYIALIIFTTIGIGLSLAGAIGLNFDLSSVTKGAEFTERKEECPLIKNEDDTLNINVSSCSVQIVKSSSDKIEVSYTSDDEYFVYSQDSLNFIPKINFDYWYNPFVSLSSKYEIKIGLPENGYKHLNVYANASSILIKGIEFNTIDLKTSASKIELDNVDVDRLMFSISACALDAGLSGKQTDYYVDIKTSMGACDIKNSDDSEDDYSKKITGIINVGSVKIKFA